MNGKSNAIRVERDSQAECERRAVSETRVKVREHGDAGLASTLPPPPFTSEAQVHELEWWLDAHMQLASELLLVEQLAEAVRDPAGDTVRRLLESIGAVRDALYELYCDAADERLAKLARGEGALASHVRDSYVWCARVAGMLATITNGLRASRPDWNAVKTIFRAADATYPAPAGNLRAAIAKLPVDRGSPVEPLRHLEGDLEALFATAERLRASLARRFATQ